MLTTPLIGLRALEESDLPLITALANDPRVRDGVGGWDWPTSLVGQSEWLRAASQNPLTRRLAVVDARTDATIGLVGLWDVDWRNRRGEIGIKLDIDSAPRGAGTQAVQLLCAWALLDMGLNRIDAVILAHNMASQRIVEKLGFRHEGTQREALFSRGKLCDVRLFALLRSDFDAAGWSQEFAGYVLGT